MNHNYFETVTVRTTNTGSRVIECTRMLHHGSPNVDVGWSSVNLDLVNRQQLQINVSVVILCDNTSDGNAKSEILRIQNDLYLVS